MYEIDEFIRQNREITDLCQVLNVLVEKENLWNNPIVCELVDIFNDKVSAHLVREDMTLYSELLREKDHDVNQMADRFLSNSTQLQKIFTNYRKCWCKSNRTGKEHENFMNDTHDMFRLVMKRVEMENSEIFPLVRERYPSQVLQQ